MKTKKIVVVILLLCLSVGLLIWSASALAQKNFDATQIDGFLNQQANYTFKELITTHGANSFRPTEKDTPYFCITKNSFGAVVDRGGEIKTERFPLVEKPIYKKTEFSEDLFRMHVQLASSLEFPPKKFAEYEEIEMVAVLNADKTESGYFLMIADTDTMVAYRPEEPSGWVIELKKSE